MITLRRLSCSGTSCPMLNLMACHPPEEDAFTRGPLFFCFLIDEGTLAGCCYKDH
ncbi:hypothetical protein NC652_024030 [Populus alba x Populus x berolinensis]|nr:hypothetical protein NC652_024030 [Populus alba x Populus x berolinensis]